MTVKCTPFIQSRKLSPIMVGILKALRYKEIYLEYTCGIILYSTFQVGCWRKIGQ